MKRALLSSDVTTKVLVRHRLIVFTFHTILFLSQFKYKNKTIVDDVSLYQAFGSFIKFSRSSSDLSC